LVVPRRIETELPMTTLPGYFPFGSLSPEAITIVPEAEEAPAGQAPAPVEGVVSGELGGTAVEPPATVIEAVPRRRTVPLEHLCRLVDEAHEKFQRAVKDYRRVEGVVAPTPYGITFSAMRVMFHKWVELAALSLESAGEALDTAMAHVLDHLYERAASGTGGGARHCREVLEQLDAMRGQVGERQRFLGRLLTEGYQ
jgi:hypothetical protein